MGTDLLRPGADRRSRGAHWPSRCRGEHCLDSVRRVHRADDRRGGGQRRPRNSPRLIADDWAGSPRPKRELHPTGVELASLGTNWSEVMRKILSLSLAAATAAALSMPAFADQPQDAWITTKVKMELLTGDNTDPMHINVDTMDGIVTLHGQVDSDAAKMNAAAEAKGVKGVKEVRNMLAVVPKAAKDKVAASDD